MIEFERSNKMESIGEVAVRLITKLESVRNPNAAYLKHPTGRVRAYLENGEEPGPVCGDGGLSHSTGKDAASS